MKATPELPRATTAMGTSAPDSAGVPDVSLETGIYLAAPLESAALANTLKGALGNLLRGLPLNKDAEFFLPLWTNFSIQGDLGVLDWYTISVGVLAVAALALHGALWIAYKVSGRLEEAASAFAQHAIWTVAALSPLVTLATFLVQPHARHRCARSVRTQPRGNRYFAGISAGPSSGNHYRRRLDRNAGRHWRIGVRHAQLHVLPGRR